MKILVVYRQKEVVNQIKMVLREKEPFIRFSDSGLDGLLAARVENFDLIICGTDLPVITGFEVVRSIRTSSINRHVRVLFLTENQDEATLSLGHTLRVEGMLSPDEIPSKLPQMAGSAPEITLQAAKKAFRFI